MNNRTIGDVKQKKKRSRTFLFIKTLLLTLSVLAILLVVSGWTLMKAMVKPPEIPKTSLGEADYDLISYIPYNPGTEAMSPANKLLSSGRAPDSMLSSDRKELFYTFMIVCLDGGVNSDTLIVASYNGAAQEANLISIPRDCLVNVNRSIRKINGAYPTGALNGGGMEGGVAQLKRELKAVLGFEPDFYICVDFKAFEEMVDALGGIEVDVPFKMDYYDPAQDLRIDINQGIQHLDGGEALKFARYRKGSGSGSPTITDYERIENQQAVIAAAMERLLKPTNILKVPEFLEIFMTNVHTDIRLENLLWFADQLNTVRGTDALAMYTLPTTGTSGPPNYYEFIDKNAALELINRTINPYVNEISGKDVNILDHE